MMFNTVLKLIGTAFIAGALLFAAGSFYSATGDISKWEPSVRFFISMSWVLCLLGVVGWDFLEHKN